MRQMVFKLFILLVVAVSSDVKAAKSMNSNEQAQVKPTSTMTFQRQLQLTELEELNNWVVVNDTVMGGRSNSRIFNHPRGLLFAGDLSLENNGGFASIRRIYNQVDWQDKQPLRIAVQGDGRVYQFRLRTDRNLDGVAYSVNFSTIKGEVVIYEFQPEDFVAQWRGRRVTGAAPLQFSDVRQLGFLLGDKNEGSFALLVEEVVQP